jgi:hypothetical protein
VILLNSTAVLIFDAYFQNAASANAQYTGDEFYLSGEVLSVEQGQNGGYESCVGINGSSGCRFQSAGDMMIWNWANQAAAEQVPTGYAPFVARCMNGGFQNENLILNSCVIVNGNEGTITSGTVTISTANTLTGSKTTATTVRPSSTSPVPVPVVVASIVIVVVVVGTATAIYMRRRKL